MKTTTITAVSVGTIFTGLCAYAIYFDHRRRTDPEFRKALRRESRKQARALKQEAEAHGVRHKAAVKAAVAKAKEQGFPTDVEEKEAFFMNEVARGETLGSDDLIDAALCFYKALKVYPNPRDLITIYDKTVSKPILDVLAEMIAIDKTIAVGPFGPGSSSGAIGVE
ncbi:MAG: hypothetical protein M1816_005420 [Peltula sp. TS41687]|nr:MAG: hypothetical protein M1816_005420 [Peltula sp. TS41687]